MRKTFVITLLLALSTSVLSAATILSVQNGAWNDATTWDNGVPSSADDVLLYHDITSAFDQEINSLDFGTTWSPSFSSGTLEITAGIFTVDGDIAFGLNGQTNGVLTIQSGATFVSTGIITWNQGSTINIYGDLEANSFNVSNGGGGNFNVFSGGSATFTGDVNISAGNHSFNIDGSMSVEGDVSISGSASAEVDGTLNIEGNLSINDPGNKITGTGSVSAATADCPGDDCGIGSVDEVTLPVSLSFFKLEAFGETRVKITWQTASEINNDYFVLYRSTNGSDFEAVTTILGNGTTNDLINYEYVDQVTIRSTNYYYLQQVDFDGKYEKFNIKKIILNTNTVITDILYPSPANNNTDVFLQAQPLDKTSLVVSIFDMTSRESTKLSYEFEGNVARLLTSEHLFKPGIYLLKVNYDQQSYTKRLIIK